MFFKRSFVSKLVISILALIFIFSQIPSINAAEEIDQYCSNSDGGWSVIRGHSDISQTFVPMKNRLTRLGIVLKGTGSGNVYIRIMKGDTTIGSGSVTEPNGEKIWVYEDFDDLNLTPGDTYRIKLTASSFDAGWYRSPNNSCDESGSGYLDGEQKTFDWNYGTWGWTYTPPAQDQPANDGNDDQQTIDDNDSSTAPTDQEGVSEGTGDEPSSKTSDSIKTVTNLEAGDVADDQGGVIKLTWDLSTSTNIDGYYIFRSTDKEEGYKNIAKADPDVKSYLDDKAQVDNTYYYLIRSYKGDDQSADSNKVLATSVDNLPPVTPENFIINQQLDDRLIFTWDKNSDQDLAGYQLEVVELQADDQSIEIPVELVGLGKDDTEYILIFDDHSQVDQAKQIRYYLRAKDENGNLSDQAGPLSAQEKDNQVSRTTIWYVSLIALAILLAILGGLIWWERKNKKKRTGKKTSIDIKKKK